MWQAGKDRGLATVFSSFLSQFMHIPFVGTLIVTGIYMLAAWLLGRIGEKMTGGRLIERTGLSSCSLSFPVP